MSHPITPEYDLFSRRIDAARRFFPGQFGLAAHNLRTGEELQVDGHALFPTASTYKVPVLIEVFRQEAADLLSLDDTIVFTEESRRLGSGVMRDLSLGLALPIRDLAMLMVIVSDNTATRLLLNRIGGWKAVNDAMAELGFLSFILHGPEERERMEAAGLANRALAECTPADLTSMMVAIAEGSIVSTDACAAMRHILGRQHYLDQASRYLGRDPYATPGDVTKPLEWVGSKSGMMDGMRADTGIWRLPDGTEIAFATMNEGSADFGYGNEHNGDILNGVLGWSIVAHFWTTESLGPMPRVESAWLDRILGEDRLVK
jgi:beta-lactamase class A